MVCFCIFCAHGHKDNVTTVGGGNARVVDFFAVIAVNDAAAVKAAAVEDLQPNPCPCPFPPCFFSRHVPPRCSNPFFDTMCDTTATVGRWCCCRVVVCRKDIIVVLFVLDAAAWDVSKLFLW